jgi:peptidyl-dipeptidase A
MLPLALATSLASAVPCAEATETLPSASVPSAPAAPTAVETNAFLARAEKELTDLSALQSRASWVNSTYITDDTDVLAAYFAARQTEMAVRFTLEAARYRDAGGLSDDARRKLDLLRSSIDLPAPTTTGAALELSTLSTRLTSAYGKGKGTLRDQPIAGTDIEDKIGTNRNPAELKEMWTSWHDSVGAPMRGEYARLVEIANAGAQELGYADVGALWRSRYDLPPEAFVALTDRLWAQVKPLYEQLHCYVRTKLHERYGEIVQPASGPIRADLLGNMWAQEWSRIYDIVAPQEVGDVGYDLTNLLVTRSQDARGMVQTGEAFFSSLGLEPLPQSFWQRSMLTKPADRDVVCHASAWGIDTHDDLRLKMCIKVDASDFVTVHHELGHIYYYRAYQHQPYLYRNGANDGFHEAIGDMIALSVTPEYLSRIGLLDQDKIPSPDKDIGLLLRQAMDKIAFLPFGLLVDRWRWGVFDGSIPASSYNKAWNDLRLTYQGIVPPVERTEAQFDPGAKFHIPSNTPYARYFLAALLQFQLHKAACDQSGWTGPLHRCSVYGDQEVGRRLNTMLALGASKPWPDALEEFTGVRDLSADALVSYFQPLMTWLKGQNRERSCGW